MPFRNVLLLALLWLNSHVFGQGFAADSVTTVSVSLVSAASVSDRFQRETEAATKSVPPHVWKALDAAGWRVQLAEFVVDAVPSLQGVRPPGWPQHLTWDNSDAIHLPADKLLILAEKRRNRSGDIVPSSRVAGVLRHEIGHAFDLAAGRHGQPHSASPQFVQAYRQDRSRIAAAQQRQLSYYLQDNRGGLQEAFAEAFAVALGGGSSDMTPAEFESHFPRVMAYTRATIERPATSLATAPPVRAVPSTPVRRRLPRRR